MFLSLPLIVLLTAIWASVDAQSIAREKNLPKGPGGYSALEWGLVILLLWIIGFPLYLVKRGEAKSQAPMTSAQRQAAEAADAGKRSPMMFLVGFVGIIVGAFALLGAFANSSGTAAAVGIAALTIGILAMRKPKPRAAVLARR